ncbi:MAG: hypothetical protein PHC91_08550, partial [Eubacteriales bacterium]|nr:hypothetical protein [Eubacteriales bacterium]
MKKMIAVLLLIVMAMSLVACSGGSDSGTDLVKVGDTTINDSELEQYLAFTAFIQGIDVKQFPE